MEKYIIGGVFLAMVIGYFWILIDLMYAIITSPRTNKEELSFENLNCKIKNLNVIQVKRETPMIVAAMSMPIYVVSSLLDDTRLDHTITVEIKDKNQSSVKEIKVSKSKYDSLKEGDQVLIKVSQVKYIQRITLFEKLLIGKFKTYRTNIGNEYGLSDACTV